VLHYQPKLELTPAACAASRRCCAGTGPATAWCIPAEFVPVMEETGLVVRVGEWIIDEACRQIAAWNKRACASAGGGQRVEPPVRRGRPGRRHPRGAGARTRRRAGLLELELTESALMSNAEHTIEVLDAPEGARHPDRDRRLRHRLFEPGLPEALPDRQAEDRHRLRARHRHQSGRRGDRAGHHQHGAQPAHAGDRRRGGDARPDGLPAAPPLRRDPGLPLRARCRPRAGALVRENRAQPTAGRRDATCRPCWWSTTTSTCSPRCTACSGATTTGC
jgi:hypothetical protein